MNVSLPPPPCSLSLPSPPVSRSLPPSPISLSLPAPPKRISSPPLPLSVSGPLNPLMRSLPPAPKSLLRRLSPLSTWNSLSGSGSGSGLSPVVASTAPMSIRLLPSASPSTIREKPSPLWSNPPSLLFGFPASITGLPLSGAWVRVLPPLSFSAPSFGSIGLLRLPRRTTAQDYSKKLLSSSSVAITFRTSARSRNTSLPPPERRASSIDMVEFLRPDWPMRM